MRKKSTPTLFKYSVKGIEDVDPTQLKENANGFCGTLRNSFMLNWDDSLLVVDGGQLSGWFAFSDFTLEPFKFDEVVASKDLCSFLGGSGTGIRDRILLSLSAFCTEDSCLVGDALCTEVLGTGCATCGMLHASLS